MADRYEQPGPYDVVAVLAGQSASDPENLQAVAADMLVSMNLVGMVLHAVDGT